MTGVASGCRAARRRRSRRRRRRRRSACSPSLTATATAGALGCRKRRRAATSAVTSCGPSRPRRRAPGGEVSRQAASDMSDVDIKAKMRELAERRRAEREREMQDEATAQQQQLTGAAAKLRELELRRQQRDGGAAAGTPGRGGSAPREPSCARAPRPRRRAPRRAPRPPRPPRRGTTATRVWLRPRRARPRRVARRSPRRPPRASPGGAVRGASLQGRAPLPSGSGGARPQPGPRCGAAGSALAVRQRRWALRRRAPAGWSEAIDRVSGKVYYVNAQLGQSSWERPRAASLGLITLAHPKGAREYAAP